MERRTENTGRSGTIGWLAIAGFVAAWDRYEPETLSHATERGLENPYMRPLIFGVGAVTLAHCLHKIPERADPFYRIVDRRQ
jgi:hypothetical protein